MFERRIAGFPKIGHFNTWLMDLLQNLVGHNHNICYCPNWSNTSEFETTPEQHGIVPLHSKVLGDAIGRRVLLLRASEERRRVPKKDRFESKMSKDQKFLCERTGLGMPCLPFTTRNQAENLLFSKIMMERSGNFDEQEMCLDWVNSCDGQDIFPKLPYYMRSHYKSWKRNQAARNQVASADFKNGAERLKKLNQDSAKALARPEVQAPMRMGNDRIEAGEAPF
jgi:hypothetical protein